MIPSLIHRYLTIAIVSLGTLPSYALAENWKEMNQPEPLDPSLMDCASHAQENETVIIGSLASNNDLTFKCFYAVQDQDGSLAGLRIVDHPMNRSVPAQLKARGMTPFNLSLSDLSRGKVLVVHEPPIGGTIKLTHIKTDGLINPHEGGELFLTLMKSYMPRDYRGLGI